MKTIFLVSLDSLCTEGGLTKLTASSTIHGRMLSSPGSLARDAQLTSAPACLTSPKDTSSARVPPVLDSPEPCSKRTGSFHKPQAALPESQIQKPGTAQHYTPGPLPLSAGSYSFISEHTSLAYSTSRLLNVGSREPQEHVRPACSLSESLPSGFFSTLHSSVCVTCPSTLPVHMLPIMRDPFPHLSSGLS